LLSAPSVDTDVPSHAGCVTALRAVAMCWAASLLPAYPRVPNGRAGQSGLPSSLRGLARRNDTDIRLDQIQYKATQQHTYKHITHTHRHLRAAQWAR